MRLVHFSNQPLSRLVVKEQKTGSKPTGFWVSDENQFGWSKWTEREDYPIGRYQTAVEIADDHNILIISTPEELLEFTAKFKADQSASKINWEAVAELYDGIIISPYQGVSDKTAWYYGWDCASGCVWNPRSLSLSPIKTPS